jgi:hypothetical protein
MFIKRCCREVDLRRNFPTSSSRTLRPPTISSVPGYLILLLSCGFSSMKVLFRLSHRQTAMPKHPPPGRTFCIATTPHGSNLHLLIYSTVVVIRGSLTVNCLIIASFSISKYFPSSVFISLPRSPTQTNLIYVCRYP